jgi:hypothetical protein
MFVTVYSVSKPDHDEDGNYDRFIGWFESFANADAVRAFHNGEIHEFSAVKMTDGKLYLLKEHPPKPMDKVDPAETLNEVREFAKARAILAGLSAAEQELVQKWKGRL